MNPVARALTEELLAHHRYFCRPGRSIEQCTINYRPLCERAGYPDLGEFVGRHLGETAQWCHDLRLPPLNSLAVNADTRQPGSGYEKAVGCNPITWAAEARACIDCLDYPASVDAAHVRA